MIISGIMLLAILFTYFFTSVTAQTSCPDRQRKNTADDACIGSCAPGKYISGDNCLACHIGKYSSSSDATSCMDCQNGYHQTATGSASCLACIPGKFQDQIGQNSCNQCVTGKYRSVNDAANACLACPSGYYQTASGSASCLACIPGKFQDQTGQTVCLDCQANTFSSAMSSTACLDCEQGMSSNSGAARCNNAESSITCGTGTTLDGTVCKADTTTVEKITCGAGTTLTGTVCKADTTTNTTSSRCTPNVMDPSLLDDLSTGANTYPSCSFLFIVSIIIFILN